MTKELDEKQVFSLMEKASNLPGVHIERDRFLQKEFAHKSYDIGKIIALGPVAAGVSKEELKEISKGIINLETTKVTAISTAAGVPGGFAMFGTIPADLVQYLGFMMRTAQKLLYLYGVDGAGQMTDSETNALLIAMGVMLGAEAANNGIRALCKTAAVGIEKRTAQKALTKGFLYPVVKKICAQLGVKLTKQSFAKAVGKIVPVAGGLISGALTLATFKPSCNKLRATLEKEVFASGEIPHADETILDAEFYDVVS